MQPVGRESPCWPQGSWLQQNTRKKLPVVKAFKQVRGFKCLHPGHETHYETWLLIAAHNQRSTSGECQQFSADAHLELDFSELVTYIGACNNSSSSGISTHEQIATTQAQAHKPSTAASPMPYQSSTSQAQAISNQPKTGPNMGLKKATMRALAHTPMRSLQASFASSRSG
jgi:hypothetical protein